MGSHRHDFGGEPWLFDTPDNTAVFVCSDVFSGARPILRVSHDHDGDWQFLCGYEHSEVLPKIECLGCVVKADQSLLPLADLPAGWGAEREPSGPWVRSESPVPNEDTDA